MCGPRKCQLAHYPGFCPPISDCLSHQLLPLKLRIVSFFPPSLREVMSASYYSLLGVPVGATVDEIQKAFKRSALHCHPDRTVHLSDRERSRLQQEFVQLSQAHEVLSHAPSRADYDAKNCFNLSRRAEAALQRQVAPIIRESESTPSVGEEDEDEYVPACIPKQRSLVSLNRASLQAPWGLCFAAKDCLTISKSSHGKVPLGALVESVNGYPVISVRDFVTIAAQLTQIDLNVSW